MKSGPGDEWHAKALAAAPQLLPPHLRRAVRLATHIEVKLAVRMREEERSHETVLIDRGVCGRGAMDRDEPLTCDKTLKYFLPPGATPTVVESDGSRVTYRGRG
ncbi:DddA-like double-stranded DNA deaminase toxin [Saccharothrix australiensis]|uniref:DddA-like double-stranded DNA deaminase toxin n=1 Tax=Saccharothrix australiensis TaxID=2072 RepID=UPI003CCC831D